jgi:hypothetical protein
VTATATAGADVVATTTIDHVGGPGVIDLTGLIPDTTHRITITDTGGSVERSATTMTAPSGEELFRFATISDLHLGSDHFGFFKHMIDNGDHPDPFAMRSARAAIEAARVWGARHLIIKGDAAHHARAADFALVGDLVDEFGDMAMSLLPGNHDTDLKEQSLPATVGRRRLAFERGVSCLDLPGVRIVLGDTTMAGEGTGTLRRIGRDLIEAAAASDRGVFIAVHQQLQRSDPVRYWPPGIPRKEVEPFLDELDASSPRSVVTSGHTHRNRARTHRSVLITEVASTHHWPGVWAGYIVYEGGIRQVIRRIGARDIIDWHEYSKNAVASIWQHYATGRLDDRCLTHRWA